MTRNMKTEWVNTPIEDLQALDVVLHAGSVWVIRNITRNSEGLVLQVTRVDDGVLSQWTFRLGFIRRHEYLMKKRIAV